MGMLSRISDLMSAEVNAVLDRAENPVKTVRLLILQMEEKLLEVKAASTKNHARCRHIERHLGELDQNIVSWEQKAQRAVEASEDELAKAALGQKLHLERQKAWLEKQLSTAQTFSVQCDEDIQMLESRLSETRDRFRALTGHDRNMSRCAPVTSDVQHSESSEAKFRFDQCAYRVDQLLNESELFPMSRRTIEQQLDALERKAEVDRALESLKLQVGSVTA